MITATDIPSAIELLQSKFDTTWPHIQAAREAAGRKREEIMGVLLASKQKFSSGDTSLVVFGSLARDEWTSQSDLDWGLPIDSQAHPEHLKVAQTIAKLFRENELGKDPGPTGVFGNMIFSHELVHQVGGNDDTNSNTTRRLLLLLESTPIGVGDAYNRVVRVILERYFETATNLLTPDQSRYRVPRFLLNDIVRFWRTMAVDFASKQRERPSGGWALRNIKLRMSRKLIFVAGLLTCFSCYSKRLPILHTEPEKSAGVVIEHLSGYVNKTPLQILADALLGYDNRRETVLALFNSYDAFLECLDNEGQRVHLDKLSFEASKDDKVFQHTREISHQFQQGLDNLFFQDSKELQQLIQKYGIF